MYILCLGRFLKNLRKRFQDKLAHASSTAEESISNIITVRSFSNESKMVDLYSNDINESYYLGRKLAVLIGVFMGVVSMFMYVSHLVSGLFFFSYSVVLLRSLIIPSRFLLRELHVLYCGTVAI